jgi:hypothetical protein
LSKKFPRKFSAKKVAMEHKVTFKTKDGTIKEQRFDDFNQFADTIETLATDYYAGIRPEIEVETIYQDMIKKERVTENGRVEPEAEFIRD